jgi:hypothetical protein
MPGPSLTFKALAVVSPFEGIFTAYKKVEPNSKSNISNKEIFFTELLPVLKFKAS